MDGNARDDVIEIDLREIVGLLLHWIWLICLCGVTAAGIGFMISKFVLVPQYQSTTSVYILSKSNNNALTISDTQLATQLTKDYEKLITSRYVLEQVMEDLELSSIYTYESFGKKVSVKNTNDTRIIDITVKDENPHLARKIADAIRDVSASHITQVMDIDAVNVVDEASLPVKPSEPSVRIWTLGGLVLGVVCSAMLVIVRFMLDDTIKSSEDIENYLGLSTLALIPDADMEHKKSRKRKSDPAPPRGKPRTPTRSQLEVVRGVDYATQTMYGKDSLDEEILDYNE